MLVRGSIIKLHINTFEDPHNKYIVILGRCPNNVSYSGIFVNSNINLNINTTQELKDHQVEVLTTNNIFLDHTSYIDCSKLNYYPCAETDALIKADPRKLCGYLFVDDHSKVKAIIKSSKILLPYIKKQYGLN